MIPILMSIAGALAGKAVVSAVEWMAEDKPTEGSVVKSDVRGLGASGEATKVSVSPAAQQKSIASRYDPARLSPQRLAALSEELKTNGKISSTDQQLMMRVANDARDSDINSKTGNRFLTNKNMVAEMDERATLALKNGNKAEAAQYQKLGQVLKDMRAKGSTASAAA